MSWFLDVKNESIIREIVAAFSLILSMCLSKRREKSIKIQKSRIVSDPCQFVAADMVLAQI